jgi:hypothetical protein
MVAGLDAISNHLQNGSSFRTRAAAAICRLSNSPSQDKQSYIIYETFIGLKKKFKCLDFINKLISVDVQSETGISSVCKLVRECCNLHDPWEKFATYIDDQEIVAELFAEKCQEWLQLLNISEKFHSDILEFIRTGSNKEKVEKISRQTLLKVNKIITNRDWRESWRPYLSVVILGECFSFFHAFLCQFQIDRHRSLYQRMQFLWIKLYTDEAFEFIASDYVSKRENCQTLRECLFHFPRETVDWLANEQKKPESFWDSRDIAKYVMVNSGEWPETLSDFIQELINKDDTFFTL